VLEYEEGSDLRSKLKFYKYTIPERLALNWFTQICLALLTMHHKGVVHRDIQPENILIIGERVGGIAKLGDFGTVQCPDFASFLAYKAGTPLYYAPERRSKNYSFPADIWAIGVILYEMACGGAHPFRQDGSIEEYILELPRLEMK